MSFQFEPVQTIRFFTFDEKYNEINWASFKNVVEKFKKQMNKWYFEPASVLKRTPHAGFPQMALACLLIDTLSQYCDGKYSSSQTQYKDFCRNIIPGMKRQFRSSFYTQIYVNGIPTTKRINDAADAFYCGMRCGVLHEAHSSIFTVISGSEKGAISIEDGIVLNNGKPAQALVVDPGKLQKILNVFFKEYINRLLSNGQKDLTLKSNFKKKFEHSFGVKIGQIGT